MQKDTQNRSIPSEVENKDFPQNTVGALANEEVRKIRERVNTQTETKSADITPRPSARNAQPPSEADSFGENGLVTHPMEMTRTDYPPGSFAGPTDPFSILLMQILGQMQTPRAPRRNPRFSVPSAESVPMLTKPSMLPPRAPHPFVPRGLVPFGKHTRRSISPTLGRAARPDNPELMPHLPPSFGGSRPGVQYQTPFFNDPTASDEETIVIFFRPHVDDSDSMPGVLNSNEPPRGAVAVAPPNPTPIQPPRVPSKGGQEDPAQAMISILHLLDEIMNEANRGRGRGRRFPGSRGTRRRHWRSMR